MKHTVALADRAAGLVLDLVAAANLVFVAAFVATLLMATRDASGQETTCTGKDLLAAMERDDPALLEQIRAEAASVENGQGMLWRIEKDGVEPSFVFGTMHMADPRVVALPAEAREAFDTATTVVIETTEVLDQAKMMAAVAAEPELMMFTDGTTLSSLLSEQDRETVEMALQERGIPFASVQKMKPWMIASLVALPACELARKAAGAPVLDVVLAQDAEAAGKRLEGLETIAEQLGAMASLPMEFHIEGLIETLKLGDRIDDVIETMVALYLEGETGTFWPFFRAVLPEGESSATGYVAFEETMITARNRTMADRSAPFIDAGGAFVAVGALHLPGPEGLVALLRDAGYAIEAVE
jgi:uncharacterized protein YbaP (TraB family)